MVFDDLKTKGRATYSYYSQEVFVLFMRICLADQFRRRRKRRRRRRKRRRRKGLRSPPI